MYSSTLLFLSLRIDAESFDGHHNSCWGVDTCVVNMITKLVTTPCTTNRMNLYRADYLMLSTPASEHVSSTCVYTFILVMSKICHHSSVVKCTSNFPPPPPPPPPSPPPLWYIFSALMFSPGHSELALPVHVTGVQCSGMPLVEVTLYEQVCVHLCATVAVMPAKHFNILVCVMCVWVVCVCVYVVCMSNVVSL